MRVKRVTIGIRGLTPGKIFRDHALKVFQKAPVFESRPFKEAKDHIDGSLSRKSLNV